MAMRWSTSACLRLRPAAAMDRGNREGAHEGKKAMIRRTTVRVSTLRRVVVSLPLLGLLWPRPAGAEEGEKIGGIGVAVEIDISIGRAPCAEQEQQVGGVDIAIAIEVAEAS